MSDETDAGTGKAGLYRWVVENDIPTVVRRMQAIREGSPDDPGPHRLAPRPGEAMRILEMFALNREIGDLLTLESETEDSESFSPLDARAILALAALTRPVKQAAELAVKKWKQEKNTSAAGSAHSEYTLTGRILHDVTAQRSVQDVAEFVAECRNQEADELVDMALNAFRKTETSGRTSFDKARLYIALRDGQHGKDASYLLEKMLLDAAEDTVNREGDGFRYRVGVVGALRHLSPSERIVEDWIDKQLEDERNDQKVIDLVTNLHHSEPAGCKGLAEHVGLKGKPHQVIRLCETLASTEGLDERLVQVRRRAATRSDKGSLAEIIERWHRPGSPLAATFRDLLDDIIVGGNDPAHPREIEFLDDIYQALGKRDAPAGCRDEFLVALAEHVEGRDGAQVAFLLGKVGRKDLGRAAREVNKRLVRRLFADETGDAGDVRSAEFADYLGGLQELPEAASLTSLALRRLSEPADPGAGSGRLPSVVGDIATRLYRKKGGPRIAFDLLERCLENDQWLTAEGAVEIAGRVRPVVHAADRQWDLLLSATIGRWADTNRRDEIVDELRARGRYEDVAAIIQPLQ